VLDHCQENEELIYRLVEPSDPAITHMNRVWREAMADKQPCVEKFVTFVLTDVGLLGDELNSEQRDSGFWRRGGNAKQF
jgi:hypothetical protein